jgi:predicted HicB family RNase H-like nuclease
MPDDNRPKKTAVFNQRIDPQLKHDLEVLARSQDRSLAQYVQRVLKEHVAKATKKPRP